MRFDKELLTYQGFFVGAFFLIGLGLTHVFDSPPHLAGALVPIVLGLIIGPIAFVGLRQKVKNRGN